MQHLHLRDSNGGFAEQWLEENALLVQLITEAKDGNLAAFEQIYDCTARWLLSVVRRLVDDGQAEDVLAEVYLQVWKTLGSYDESRAAPRVWLAVIARSRALDHLRRERRVRQVHGSPQMVMEAESQVQDGPEQLLSRAEECLLVRLSLSGTCLSSYERTVLGLAYFRESTQQEISVLMGMPLGTIKTIMVRALDKLKVQIAVPSAIVGPGTAPA